MEAKDLYRALEFAHYAERLRDTVTVLGLSRNTRFRDVVLDIKVLASYRARVVVVVPDPNFELQRTLALMNTHGGRFRLIEAQEPRDPRRDRLRVDPKLVEAALEDDEVPVVVHHGLSERGSDLAEVEHMCRELGFALEARRVVGTASSVEPSSGTSTTSCSRSGRTSTRASSAT